MVKEVKTKIKNTLRNVKLKANHAKVSRIQLSF